MNNVSRQLDDVQQWFKNLGKSIDKMCMFRCLKSATKNQLKSVLCSEIDKICKDK